MIILPQYNTKTPGPNDCDNLETELKFYLRELLPAPIPNVYPHC